MLTGSEIRRKFLDFFVQKGHKEVHSSSLVPQNDPTLLFTNAGMNQFKDVFLGLEKRDYSRATTSQKCVRAGGKHNDLENVGFTNRHHTFFEMLGNFSFGDYFKKDAIAYAWELITSPQWFGIAKDRLYVTIFEGDPLASGIPGGIPADDEAETHWLAVGVPKSRIFRMGMKDNFWQMGDTGPCGPCSEIHYDMGLAASEQGHTDCAFACDCGRYVEIWNLVFMQYNRQPRAAVPEMLEYVPLPKPSIDTGMGLERVTAVLQGVISNYDTDLFVPLIEKAAQLMGTTPLLTKIVREPEHTAASLRVVADHSRATTFLISDGVLPSNEGRGYVLRKIIRRAILHGRKGYAEGPLLHRMVYAVVELMKDAYPELVDAADRVAKIVKAEELQFARTLDVGLERLEQDFRPLRAAKFLAERPESTLEELKKIFGEGVTPSDWGSIAPSPRPIYRGDRAFRLYDTFGLPRDFIEDACRDNGFALDEAGFDQAMEEQKSRARASWKGAAKQTANPAYQKLPTSTFEGYWQTRSDGCEVLAIIHNGQGVQQLSAGEEGEVILDHTPFYAESGGQVGDRGWFYSDDHNTVVAEVKGCYSPIQGVRAHQVVMKGEKSKSPPSAKNAEGWGTLKVGDRVDAVVNTDVREATMRNHTATHLLHAGLREVLGKHVKQAGSLVAPNHLRFDFSHFTAVEDEELQDIEDIINKEVLRNWKVETITDVPIDEAINKYHAMALFGEKYGDMVRVVRIGDFSTELCGGTHTAATGEIGLIKILKENSVSSGVRRVEAITGEGSLRHFRKDHQLENVVSAFVSPTLSQKTRKDGAPAVGDAPALEEATFSPADALKAELDKKDAEIKRLARELDQVRMKSASSSTANIGDKVKEVKGVKVLAHRVDNLERPQMRTLVDQLRDKIGSGVVILGSASNGNVSLIVGVTKDLTGRVQAGKVIGPVAQKVGGKGGGRPDLAEAGGKDAGALDAALDGVYGVVYGLLG
ncbi:MAG TPA: alanine--tRNA ligase [Candidatus Sulfotelmatobacter sp.]|nr:alanine--tRNA ligase [Candidatus Sulfotelmatobacter sp.]